MPKYRPDGWPKEYEDIEIPEITYKGHKVLSFDVMRVKPGSFSVNVSIEGELAVPDPDVTLRIHYLNEEGKEEIANVGNRP
jgi:hypothetical protein